MFLIWMTNECNEKYISHLTESNKPSIFLQQEMEGLFNHMEQRKISYIEA
ncbi:hypothetical protein APE02nite_05810 [Alkalibacterium pelagium]|nr:hypothetical protein APE02nite_05810 [Alkalibacterium pelagium]